MWALEPYWLCKSWSYSSVVTCLGKLPNLVSHSRKEIASFTAQWFRVFSELYIHSFHYPLEETLCLVATTPCYGSNVFPKVYMLKTWSPMQQCWKMGPIEKRIGYEGRGNGLMQVSWKWVLYKRSSALFSFLPVWCLLLNLKQKVLRLMLTWWSYTFQSP